MPDDKYSISAEDVENLQRRLTVLESVDLVRKLEEKWGVTAAPPATGFTAGSVSSSENLRPEVADPLLIERSRLLSLLKHRAEFYDDFDLLQHLHIRLIALEDEWNEIQNRTHRINDRLAQILH